MDSILPPPTDTQDEARAPAAICPACRRETGRGFDILEPNGVHQTSYCCPVGHLFITRWAGVA